MADDQPQARDAQRAGEARPEAWDAAAPSPPSAAAWSNLWQAPTLLLSIALIAAGVYTAVSRAPTNDFDGALAEVEHLLADGQYDPAANRLREGIEPYLHLATRTQRARFHAAVADWLALTQPAGQDQPAVSGRVAEQYARARELGAPFDPARTERWADALVSLGEVTGAQARLAELEAMAGDPDYPPGDVRQRRNRVLRRLIENSLARPDLPYQALMQILSDYRADRMLAPADEAWAIARAAALRLQAGEAQIAIDRLLIDMRRLEAQLRPNDHVSFAELYTLLGRSYYELGEYEDAAFNLQQAMERFDGPDPVRGEALVLLSQIATADGDLDTAHEGFNQVVRDYVNTASYVPGLLGRAEVRSVLGQHPESLADYSELLDAMAREGPRSDVASVRVARSLTDRHDAALATGKLDLALDYIRLAEACFGEERAAPDVLLRIASTSRQLAENLIAPSEPEGEPVLPHMLDAGVRAEANTHFERAGRYYVEHSRAVAVDPLGENLWADSLWLAADSYDMAGRYDQAIGHFKEYLEGQPADDPRRAEAMYRLGQSYHAQGEWTVAAGYYEQVMGEHPRSPFASQSHVPLARCYIALERAPEAEQQLRQVLAGERELSPESEDYREALLTLGKMYHDDAQFVKAIEALDAAAQRYPQDPRIAEMLYRLADSYRGHAEELKEMIDAPTASRADHDRLLAMRTDHLRAALDLFGQVIENLEQKDARRLDRFRQELLRHAYFYRADCAFGLRLLDQAIEFYDQTARRYSDHYSSMTALVQIVNCYYEMNDPERAHTAQIRARVRLEQLPDEAFDDPAAVMDRSAWERWLKNSPVGEPMTARAAGS